MANAQLDRVVRAHDDLHPLGQGGGHRRDLGADGVRNGQRVRLALAQHPHAHRVVAVGAHHGDGVVAHGGREGAYSLLFDFADTDTAASTVWMDKFGCQSSLYQYV